MANSRMSGRDDAQTGDDAGKKRQQLLLLLLLLLVAAGAYVYFFTGIITPRTPAVPPQTSPTQVKQAIPPRPETNQAKIPDTAKASAVQEKAATTANRPAVPVTPAAPVAKPVPVPAAAKADAAKGTVLPLPPARKDPVQPAKPAASPKGEIQTGKEVRQQASAPVAKRKGSPAMKNGEAGRSVQNISGDYTLLVGEYATAESMQAAKAQLAKAGVKPLVEKKARRMTAMNRLHYAEFPDRNGAALELAKLKRLSGDSFLLGEGGKFVLYAGSYVSEQRARDLKEQLGKKGVSLTIRKSSVSIPVTMLYAGSYPSERAAEKGSVALKGRNMAVKIVKAEK